MPKSAPKTAAKSAASSASRRAKRAPQSIERSVERGVVVARAPRKVKHRYSAATADKYALYQKAVQAPDLDCAFCERVFEREYGREPLHLREDFCGTALISSEWLRRGAARTAEGFDIDPEPVAWGLAHNFGRDVRGREADPARFHFHLKDVRARGGRAPDVRIAFNFSYWVFKQREDLLAYFRAAHDSLGDEGLFILDLYGGSDTTEEQEDRRACGGFTYVWQQVRFHPGTGDYLCRIRFRFPDKSEMTAFTYDWRLWSLTELRDVLRDAGFARVDAYFEGDGEDGEGDGVYRRGVYGDNCPAWLAYLVAVK
jgi:hypothetical protein